MELSLIAALSENNLGDNLTERSPIPYYRFCGKIDEENNLALYCDYRKWVKGYSPKENEAFSLGKKCGWFSELLLLESNNMFYRWYGGRRGFDALSDKLIDYLKNEFQSDPDRQREDQKTKEKYVDPETKQKFKDYCSMLSQYNRHKKPTLGFSSRFNWRQVT